MMRPALSWRTCSVRCRRVRSAMESERASGAVGGPGQEMVRSRLAAFEVSLRDLRLAHYPQN